MNTRQQEFEKVFKGLHDYISKLYQTDLVKFKSRIGSLVQLHEIVIAISDPENAKEAKTVKDLVNFCLKEEPKFHGKIGTRQEYSTLLTNLSKLCMNSAGGNSLVASITEDLTQGYQKFEAETGDLLVASYTKILNDKDGLNDYVNSIKEEIKNSDQSRGFFYGKIDKDLAEEKQEIAENLKIAVKDFIAEPGRESFCDLLKQIVVADKEHKEALKGKIGYGKRLNKLINQLKEVALQQATTDYYVVLDAFRDEPKQIPSLNNEKDE